MADVFGGIGHNQPPSPIEALSEEARQIVANTAERVADIHRRIDKVKIKDEDDAAAAADFCKIIRAEYEAMEESLNAILLPNRDAINAAKAIVGNVIDQLRDDRESVYEKIDEFRKEQRRLAAAAKQKQKDEEARRLAQSTIAAPAPPPPPPDPVAGMRHQRGRRTRGELGGLITDRAVIEITITDISKVPAMILNSPKVREAICAVAKDMAKHIPEIDGIAIHRDVKTQVK